MISSKVKIVNKTGLHMRPANMFVTAMTKYSSDVFITAGNNRINGKSIMNIMAAGIKCGTEITIECDGKDEEAMLSEAVSLVESGFGE